MALACGPADDLDAAGKSVCSFLTACYYAADFDRAGSRADVLRRHGLIGKGPGVQVFLANHCDAVQATLLCELGRWDEAEALLTQAIGDFEQSMGMSSWHPAIALAELRIRQGRLADAEVPAEALAGGMLGLASADSPGAQITDRKLFAEVLDGVRQLQPSRIFSSHLPAAGGTSIEKFLQVLEMVPRPSRSRPPATRSSAS